jgi:hypothetical protein
MKKNNEKLKTHRAVQPENERTERKNKKKKKGLKCEARLGKKKRRKKKERKKKFESDGVGDVLMLSVD